MRVGFIGTGHIAAPMVRFLVDKGHDIAVTERNAAISAELVASHGVTVSDPQSVIARSEIVVLCLRPQHAHAVLSPLEFRDTQGVISVMAGITAAQLATYCYPATRIVQTIPLGFLEKGGCPLAAFGDTDILATLFEPENPVVAVTDETAFNAHFAICAMVPGLLDLMATGSDWLAGQTDDADTAEFYTTQLVAGFLSAMDKDRANRLVSERNALATDGTISLQMTDSLRNHGAHDALQTTLSEIGHRLNGTNT